MGGGQVNAKLKINYPVRLRLPPLRRRGIKMEILLKIPHHRRGGCEAGWVVLDARKF
jgi:hypothetical protein